MINLKKIPDTLLMGPGPSCIHPKVYKALSSPVIGHLDPLFIEIMDDVKMQLRTVMGTENQLTLPVSGTGSAGMETCFVNLIEPGDSALILINGVFGMRMAEVASRLGAEVDTLEFEWGTAVAPDKVETALKQKQYTVVAVVHAETSTGVCNPVAEIGALVKNTESLFIVDAVTSLGGMEVLADQWGIDALYSGTQKCLSVPPGLAPATFSPSAVDKMKRRNTKVPNWYLDLSLIMNYWEGEKRSYHHTAPISMIYALHQGLGLILEEGMETVYRRHAETHRFLAESLEELGLSLFVEKEARLPMLNAVTCPDGIDEAAVRSRLLKKHHIEIGAGLGPLAGKIWRIGLMGHTARKENIKKLVNALKKEI